MRDVSPTLAAYLDANTLGDRIWHLVTITPRTGAVVRLTDADVDITHGGQTYVAGGTGTAPLVEVGAITEVAGVEIGSADLRLLAGESAAFNGMRLPAAAAAGVLDGAGVEIRYYFSEPAESMSAFVGRVASAQPSSTAVTLEVESGLAELNILIPRTIYQPGCSNTLFDSQCGLLKAGFTANGSAAAGSTRTAVRSGLTAQAADYYALGFLTFTSGANSGVSRGVAGYAPATGEFTLTVPLPVAPAVGDAFTVVPGCDKRLATCRGEPNATPPKPPKFGVDNSAHFRGEPYVPKTEVSG